MNRSGFDEALEHLVELKQSFLRQPEYHYSPRVNQLPVNKPAFFTWIKNNVLAHKNSGLRNVMISLKNLDQAPGDITSDQMRALAKIADTYSQGEIRVHHEQNLVLPSVYADCLFDLWTDLQLHSLDRSNIGQITDMICCPGMDYCSLANADTIPLAEELNKKLHNLLAMNDTGNIRLKISGCMNACGHHHVGDIGILGVDKKGEHWYQITLGGRGGLDAQLGLRLGPAIHRSKIIQAVQILVETYLAHRIPNETFALTVNRLGVTPFKEKVYNKPIQNKQAA